jgi:hypothetical protein
MKARLRANCRNQKEGKMVCLDQPTSLPRAQPSNIIDTAFGPSVTERQYRAPARASREVKMNIVPIQDVSFDDEATLAMGAAFDQACISLRHFARADRVRGLIAKRIIEAAKNGERDPIRLHSQALMGFSINDVSVPVVSVGRNLPVPVYASIAGVA